MDDKFLQAARAAAMIEAAMMGKAASTTTTTSSAFLQHHEDDRSSSHYSHHHHHNQQQQQQQQQQQHRRNTTTASPTNMVIGVVKPNPSTSTVESEDPASLSAALPALQARIRNHVHELAIHSLPFEQSQSYLQAMAQDAAVVLAESDPLRYVRFYKYDIWAATQQLCRYWRERIHCFGPQRAFLPLTLTGKGALSIEDIHTIYAGYNSPVILTSSSSTSTNGNGNDKDHTAGMRNAPKFLWLDPICRNNHYHDSLLNASSMANQMRAWFYVLTVLMTKQEQETNSEEAEPIQILIQSMMNSGGVAQSETLQGWEFAAHACSIMRSVFPVHLKIHLMCIPEQRQDRLFSNTNNNHSTAGGEQDNSASIAMAAFVVFQPCINLQIGVEMHSSDENNSNAKNHEQASNKRNAVSLMSTLLGLGLTKKTIPSIITDDTADSTSTSSGRRDHGGAGTGGEWTMEHWYQWFQTQEKAEWQEYHSQQLMVANMVAAVVLGGGNTNSAAAAAAFATSTTSQQELEQLLLQQQKQQRLQQLHFHQF